MILKTFEIPQSDSRYLRSPRFVHDLESLELRVIAWESGERVLSFSVDANGVTEKHIGSVHKEVFAIDHNGEVENDPMFEQRASDGKASVWVRQVGGRHTVSCRFGVGDSIDVFSGLGTVSCPAIASTTDGAWIAFHHDIREDTGEVDIAKWVTLRFVSHDAKISKLALSLEGLDRDLAGEEQGFEFPTILVGDDGALALFGRGSHNFWRQDLNADGVTPRVGLSDGEWGSRGRRVACARLDEEQIVISMRERRAIKVHIMSSPSGGKPALIPAKVDVESSLERFETGCSDVDPAQAHGQHIYFGDIQQHSAHSDGVGCAHEVYTRARYRYGDDFVALTDHESFIGKRTSPSEWGYLQQVAEAHDDAGSFATLIAYEWTGKRYPGPGHKCVYLPKVGMPLVSRDDVPEGKDLVAEVIKLGGIASPHHIGWTGCDEEGHDPTGQPVWEICSCHGCYEHAEHPLGGRGELTDQLVDSMLAKGHRFGFTASSDSHGLLWHHGESRKRDPYRTGLTAIIAPSLGRDQIMHALSTRHCYATSGAKIKLVFFVDGHPMGSEIPQAESHDVSFHVAGTADVTSLQLITEAGIAWESSGNGKEQVGTATLGDCAYCYLRVTQADGEMAWASPVFFGEA